MDGTQVVVCEGEENRLAQVLLMKPVKAKRSGSVFCCVQSFLPSILAQQPMVTAPVPMMN